MIPPCSAFKYFYIIKHILLVRFPEELSQEGELRQNLVPASTSVFVVPQPGLQLHFLQSGDAEVSVLCMSAARFPSMAFIRTAHGHRHGHQQLSAWHVSF